MNSQSTPEKPSPVVQPWAQPFWDAAKQQRLAALSAAIRVMEKEQGMSSGFGPWIDSGLNNAHLASVATYYERVPHFEDLLKNRCGDYLPCLYVLARKERTR